MGKNSKYKVGDLIGAWSDEGSPPPYRFILGWITKVHPYDDIEGYLYDLEWSDGVSEEGLTELMVATSIALYREAKRNNRWLLNSKYELYTK